MNRNEVSWNLLRPEEPLNRYPEANQQSLKEALGQWLGTNPKGLLITAGGDQLIELFLLNCLLKNKKKIGIMRPSFECFEVFSKKFQLEVIPFELDQNFDIDLQPWLQKLADIDALILCTPNNPTGNFLNTDRFQKIINTFQGDLLIDQAYLEFTRDFKKFDYQDIVQNRPQTLVLRTFSKAFGLAGLRVGYGIASSDLQIQISQLLGPYPVSNLSLELAQKSLASWQQIMKQMDQLKVKVLRWRNFINELSPELFAYPTETNFLLLKVKNFYHPLLQDPEIKPRLRRFSGAFGETFTRLTIDLNLKDPTWNN